MQFPVLRRQEHVAGDSTAALPYSLTAYFAMAIQILRFAFNQAGLNPWKVVVTDLDHTFWNGICSEQCAAELACKGIFAAYQQRLSRFKQGMFGF
jgi:predicted enzyme involved in methoxymalonyl-ACP biosynthesis